MTRRSPLQKTATFEGLRDDKEEMECGNKTVTSPAR